MCWFSMRICRNGDSLELTSLLKDRLPDARILFVPATMLGPFGVTS